MKQDDGTVQIHGKTYKTVALRVQEFLETMPGTPYIHTSIYAIDDEVVIMRAEVGRVEEGEYILMGTGHAEENRASSQINKTSALENAETSAIGRALAAAGYAGTEFASADEVATAIGQQKAGQTTRLPAASLKPMELSDVIPKGKHKGRTVLQVLESEPDYFGWWEEKYGRDRFADEVWERLVDLKEDAIHEQANLPL